MTSQRRGAAGRDDENVAFSSDGVRKEASKAAVNLLDQAQSNMAIKFLLCLVIDIIGSSSYLLPVLGEGTDVAWAPLEAYLLQRLFGSTAISAFGFIEEALPGLDFIPTACIAFLIENVEAFSGIKSILFPKK